MEHLRMSQVTVQQLAPPYHSLQGDLQKTLTILIRTNTMLSLSAQAKEKLTLWQKLAQWNGKA